MVLRARRPTRKMQTEMDENTNSTMLSCDPPINIWVMKTVMTRSSNTIQQQAGNGLDDNCDGMTDDALHPIAHCGMQIPIWMDMEICNTIMACMQPQYHTSDSIIRMTQTMMAYLPANEVCDGEYTIVTAPSTTIQRPDRPHADVDEDDRRQQQYHDFCTAEAAVWRTIGR